MFDMGELKAQLGANFVMDTFANIKYLKLRLIKILSPRLSALGISVTETKNLHESLVNILRKS